LALDESKATDETVEKDGITFLLDKDLSKNCGVIKVDFIEAGYKSGFAISSANPIGGGASCGSSCGTGGSGGSCGC
jgi:Fe-S cluster assembly iron-binding protein IscA